MSGESRCEEPDRTLTVRTSRARALVISVGPTRWKWWIGFSLVLVVALAMRLWSIHSVPGNGFYDAAVRSMSRSWHAFFFGALQPSETISIDKPPLDLWLQVLTTRVLGYGLFALHLPEALGGAATCVLLYGMLSKPFGIPTALLGGLLLAVLPVAVLTSRSDTMDSLMAALEILAVWLSWIALRDGRMRWSILAAAVMGVAFNVKLTETLLALPALLLLWIWAAPAGARIRALLASTATFAALSLSWASMASLTPVGQRPIPVGSHNGSLWRLIFVYNGLDRFNGHGAIGVAASGTAGGPGILRLFDTGRFSFGVLIGAVTLATLLLGALALAAVGRESLRAGWRTQEGRLTIAVGVWFLSGLTFFSVMRRLQTRYLEAFTPALCATLAIAVCVLLRSEKRGVRCALAATVIALSGYVAALDISLSSWTLVSLAGLATAVGIALWLARPAPAGSLSRSLLAVSLAVGLLAAPVGTDTALIARARSDSQLNDPTTPAMSRYLSAHNDDARFELASANVFDVVGLVARDGRPVIILNDVDGRLERASRLRTQILSGQVRFYFAARGCHSRHCPANERWAYAHSVAVAHYPGLRRFDLMPVIATRKPDPLPRGIHNLQAADGFEASRLPGGGLTSLSSSLLIL
jgi:4-amino-4-deoxy-L-arabinose transferase-like glycosyltransferase